MRILHIIHQYLPEKVGGTELYTRTLAQQQIQQGHSVAIFTPAAQKSAVTPAVEEGVRVYRVAVGERGATAVFRHTFHHNQLNQAFRHILHQEQPDIIHIQHLMGLPVTLVNHINESKTPYLITLHDYWHLCANAQLITNYDNTVCQGPNYWLNCARCALARAGHQEAAPLIPAIAPIFGYRQHRLRQLLEGARALIAPTHFTGQIHQQMGISAAKIKVIPHGINIPDSFPTRKTARSGLHIGYVGGLSWQKGVHVLIKAVNQLPTEGVSLSIIGDTTAFPDYVTQLRQQAQHPGIKFVGRVPNNQLWSALVELDVVVIPTLWYETASLIVQEAFAAGVPVVASQIGALQERLENGVDGRFFPPGDSAELTKILRQFLIDHSQLKHLKDGIRPVFSIQEHSQQIEATYAQIHHSVIMAGGKNNNV